MWKIIESCNVQSWKQLLTPDFCNHSTFFIYTTYSNKIGITLEQNSSKGGLNIESPPSWKVLVPANARTLLNQTLIDKDIYQQKFLCLLSKIYLKCKVSAYFSSILFTV